MDDINRTIQDAFDECDGSTAYSNDRDRPYDGQPHIDSGLRGKEEVKGLTIRDIVDCYVKGVLLSNGVDQPELYERVQNGSWLQSDVYKMDFNELDPMAIAGNMSCEIEKMMGIFPNLPENEHNDNK